MSESRDKLERVRQAKKGNQREERSIHRCPLCGTCFVEVGAMRVHVTSTDDEAHRYKKIDDNLDVVTLWGEMDWGPGALK